MMEGIRKEIGSLFVPGPHPFKYMRESFYIFGTTLLIATIYAKIINTITTGNAVFLVACAFSALYTAKTGIYWPSALANILMAGMMITTPSFPMKASVNTFSKL